MPTQNKSKKKKAEEFFYETEDGERADAELHQTILDEGDEEAAKDVSREVAKRLGLSKEQIDKLLGKPKS